MKPGLAVLIMGASIGLLGAAVLHTPQGAGSAPLAPSEGESGTARGALQAQIDAAPHGALLTLRGRYEGGVVIRKPVHLVGERGAVIDAGGRGSVVRIEAPGVSLRSLTLRGSGIELNTEDAGVFVGAPGAVLEDLVIDDVLFGLNLKAAHGAVIRRVAIRGKDLALSRRGDGVRLWNSDAVVMTDLRLDRVRDVLVWYSRGSVLHRLDVRRSRYGVHGMYADRLRVLDGHFEDNAVGGYLMYSTTVEVIGNRFLRHRGATGVGLAFKESDDVVVRDNLLAGNVVGLYIDGTPRVPASRSEITENVIAGNETGLQLLSSASGNVIAENIWDHNAVQVRVDGGAQTGNTWTRAGRGNYWSDYAGLDLGGDGIGDRAYRPRLWFESLADRIPELRFFAGSVAIASVDFAAQALPVFAPEVVLEDARPMMRMRMPAEFRGAGPSFPFALAALILAGGGAIGLAAAAPRRVRPAP
jgi:nitrous oxidase accessory protein